MTTLISPSMPRLRPEGFGAMGAEGVQTDRQREFAAILSRRVDRPGAEPATAREQAEEAARQLVSITLVQPLLAQLRETSQAAPPFAPSSAERQFRAMSDAQLAQSIVKAAKFPLVDQLARQMLARLEGGSPGATAADKEVQP